MASAGTIKVVISQKEPKRRNSTPKNEIDSSMSIENSLDNVVVNRAVNETISQVSEMALYSIEKHLSLTDDYVGQRYLKAGKEVISKTMSMGSSIMAGAVMGGVVGAIVGAVLSLSSMAFDIFKNYDQQNIMIRQMDAQLSYQRQRAGYSLTSGSIGENK